MAKTSICIDAGHGYNTTGKRSCPFKKTVTHKYKTRTVKIAKGVQLREHCANAGVADYLDKELIKRGYDIEKSGYTTSTKWTKDICADNPSDDVRNRQATIKKLGCDLCVSIHFNACGDGVNFNNGNGIETYYHADSKKVLDGKKFAEIIHKHVRKVVPNQTDRGCLSSSAMGMCNSKALNVKATCLVELAFMTNQNEAENIFCNPEMWYKFAIAIADGIDEYIG